MLNTTFRNVLVASGLFVGATLLIAPTALAQTSDGEVTGVVAPISTLTFSPTQGTTIVGGVANPAYPIGSLGITTNSATWTLQVKSAHGGQLRNIGASTELTQYIAYTGLTVSAIDGTTITPVTFGAVNTDVLLIDAVYSDAAASGVAPTVTAAIAAGQYVPHGTYRDTLTFTLTSN
ncbi:hypothetical protein [Leptolyngbya sp. PCC 6406]|uniref:hypothetical protein n=1 Tax=Leptolyngbya sp. PCC 6406 TaxID=1173264 RepID=UPI0002ACA2CD|nr:hypothetical protein [Leptolyngbya sp. PCC 6406]